MVLPDLYVNPSLRARAVLLRLRRHQGQSQRVPVGRKVRVRQRGRVINSDLLDFFGDDGNCGVGGSGSGGGEGGKRVGRGLVLLVGFLPLLGGGGGVALGGEVEGDEEENEDDGSTDADAEDNPQPEAEDGGPPRQLVVQERRLRHPLYLSAS